MSYEGKDSADSNAILGKFHLVANHLLYLYIWYNKVKNNKERGIPIINQRTKENWALNKSEEKPINGREKINNRLDNKLEKERIDARYWFSSLSLSITFKIESAIG